jgi:hypothetical protein
MEISDAHISMFLYDLAVWRIIFIAESSPLVDSGAFLCLDGAATQRQSQNEIVTRRYCYTLLNVYVQNVYVTEPKPSLNVKRHRR